MVVYHYANQPGTLPILSAAITATDLTITLDSWPFESDVTANFHIRIDNEVILVASRSGSVLTVSSTSDRGVENTAAASHVSGSSVRVVLTRTGLRNVSDYLRADTATAKGDLYVATASGVVTRLAVGSNGQFLKANSAQSTGLEWGSGGSGGALVALAQQTASASAQLDFTSFISASYSVYQVEFDGIVPATTGAHLQIRVGTGAGPTYDTGSTYVWMYSRVNDAGTVLGGGSAGAVTAIRIAEGIKDTDSMSGTYKVFALQSTSLQKRFIGDIYLIQDDSTNYRAMFGGSWVTTGTAVTALRFFMSTGNIASGTIRIYGIADS